MIIKPIPSKRFLGDHVSATAISVCLACLFLASCGKPPETSPRNLKIVSTFAGLSQEFGEPFGVAIRNEIIYVSDGQNGKILTVSGEGAIATFVNGLDTPSGLAFDKNGDLYVADSGSSSIKKIDASGRMVTLAGIDGQPGSADGNASQAQFHAPIGIAVGDDGAVYIADTYNDRIRVIRNGAVSTLAGSGRGFADGIGALAKFDTPCGLALTRGGNVLVADLGNRRIRVVQPDGTVSTVVGTGKGELKDGPLGSADVYSPSALAVDTRGSIFFTDGNAIRVIREGVFPFVETLGGARRGLVDGPRRTARFNRPSGLAIDLKEDLYISDSDSRLLRTLSVNGLGKQISNDEIQKIKPSPEQFRTAAPARWPYDPPDSKREVAGTMGELRGEIRPGDNDIHYHNGLDIAGGYGETARFVRDEKVLLPLAVDNFGTLREMIRMPTMGYIHIRIGRDQSEKPFGDRRFIFDGIGKPTDVRVPRGSKFHAGDAIGTLNPMNHVHLVAGPSGYEMNALDALILPGISDSISPTIERITLFDENWREIETGSNNSRIKLAGKLRVVVRAYDRMDGNAERRRLGAYSVGYGVYKTGGETVTDHRNSVIFKRLPEDRTVPFVYALGSKSGATGETIFNYIATNEVNADSFKEDFLDLTGYESGQYVLKVFVSDYFGNTATKDINFEVTK